MILPEGKALVAFVEDIIEKCDSSQGTRTAAYRQYAQWIETGRGSGGLALANMLNSHIDRLQSHLFSPSELQFSVDFENHYDKQRLLQAEMAGRVITREWERKNIDMLFGQGIKESLNYGACILKQIGLTTRAATYDSSGEIVTPENQSLSARLVMPWAFGVYNETVNTLDDQEAVVETVYLTEHEVWRRIRQLPNAESLFKTIKKNASKNEGVGAPTSFMHQVLSTAVLNTSGSPAQPTPGGIVQLSNDPSYSILGPQVAADLIPMKEVWVKDDGIDDWVTIQYIKPGVIIGAQFKKTNLFAPKDIPFSLIQANTVTNYFWGRSEIVDIMELQNLLTTSLDDMRRVMGLQFDKLLAFPGYDGMTDELYGQFRTTGYIGLPQGSSVTDLTPQMPSNAIEFISMIKKFMEEIGGFANILSGQGEAGVRAGNHAETLIRTASPRLRDRALLVERQCATAADATLSWMEAKNAKTYWTDPDTGEESEFLLGQLPDDRRVSVDSHSSSPIYEENHQQMVAFGLKAGIIDPESAIEMLKYPKKDILIARVREMMKQKQAFVEAHPELLTKGKGHHI